MTLTLKPPSMFGIVEPGIYRSNAPTDENLPYLEQLNLRTVLFLSPEVLLRTAVEFFNDKGIRLHNLGLDAWRPEHNWTCLCDEFIKDALEMMVSSLNLLDFFHGYCHCHRHLLSSQRSVRIRRSNFWAQQSKRSGGISD